ncbi:hypothetical protein [Clostridium estertheticum]|uniref:hypothetical protein n=1 Tax=Clostridium estertheticum TaxID=238834 RepID=UPI001C7D0F87|nr:hypothetical protein [Clostridium estertheticum]MBX4264365.1 hypothetical protein [Clostridium estertheticum]MBX4267947.1 hypothetical protein [Clostridium estertheticum]MCB2340168.1 hypothetical protein [Clostridium estertheticum]MCB2356720.1 hypothetical protein [Clostridium estertheticum]WAG39750.1 hypothetical protein LL065_15885 [Clostridium estertheticum]
MNVYIKNMSNEQMKDKFMEVKIENLIRLDAEKQLEKQLKRIKTRPKVAEVPL